MPVVVIAPSTGCVREDCLEHAGSCGARRQEIILVTDPKGAVEATVSSLVTLDLARKCPQP